MSRTRCLGFFIVALAVASASRLARNLKTDNPGAVVPIFETHLGPIPMSEALTSSAVPAQCGKKLARILAAFRRHMPAIRMLRSTLSAFSSDSAWHQDVTKHSFALENAFTYQDAIPEGGCPETITKQIELLREVYCRDRSLSMFNFYKDALLSYQIKAVQMKTSFAYDPAKQAILLDAKRFLPTTGTNPGLCAAETREQGEQAQDMLNTLETLLQLNM